MSETIGQIYTTNVPSLSDPANIQEALRLYHYGAPTGTGPGQYDINNEDTNNLVNPSIAYSLHSLQSQLNILSATTSLPVSAYNAKGALVVGTGSGTYSSQPVGADGFVLTATSGSGTGMNWIAPSVTPTNTVTLTNKTLTSPAINLSFNTQPTGYTVSLSDNGRMVEIDNADTKNLIVPKNSVVGFPIGAQIHITQVNTGQIVVVPVDGDVIINGTPGLKLRTRWSSATLIKRDTNTWLLVGDLSA